MKGITQKIRVLRFVLINSVLLNLLCAWISASHSQCFAAGFKMCPIQATPRRQPLMPTQPFSAGMRTKELSSTHQ